MSLDGGGEAGGAAAQCGCFPALGLLYLCMKHITDRYNMYYSYAPTKLNEQIHMAAINQAIFAPLLGLFWILFFSVLRLGRYQARPAPPPLPAPLPSPQLCQNRKGKRSRLRGFW